MTNLHSTFSKHVLTAIHINNIDAHALVDTGSTNSYICKNFAKLHGINQGFPNWGSQPLAGLHNKLQGEQKVYQFYTIYCINHCTFHMLKLVQLHKISFPTQQ